MSRKGNFAAIVALPVLLMLTQPAYAADSHPYSPLLYFIVFIICLVAVGPVAFTNLTRGTFDRKIGIASGGWPTVAGKIIESKKITIFSWFDFLAFLSFFISIFGGGSTFTTISAVEPVIRYEYELTGTRYEGNMLRFGTPRFIDDSQISTLLALYSAGTQITVRYDPNDKTLSVLDIGKNEATRRIRLGYFLVALPIVAVSLIGILDALY